MCDKCGGSGMKKNGKQCKKCLLYSGICPRCGGIGINKHGKPCKVCYFLKSGGICPVCNGTRIHPKKKKPCKLCAVKIKYW